MSTSPAVARIVLVSARPLPASLLAHATDVLRGVAEPPQVDGQAPSGHAAQDVSRRGWFAASLTGAARPGADLEGARRELFGPATALGVDVAVVSGPLATAPPALVVTDVDSTLITAEVIELLAAHAGTREQVAAVTERAMRGELDFAASLRERVATLAGLEAAVVDEVRASVELMPGARELVEEVHASGGRVGVVSGGFAEVVEPLAAELGIAHVAANRLEVEDGRLTGRTTGPVVDRAAKARHLREWAAADGVPLERTLAVGDGANDLDMLQAAGLGVAFCAKPVVVEQAGAAVGFPRLDAVLALTG